MKYSLIDHGLWFLHKELKNIPSLITDSVIIPSLNTDFAFFIKNYEIFPHWSLTLLSSEWIAKYSLIDHWLWFLHKELQNIPSQITDSVFFIKHYKIFSHLSLKCFVVCRIPSTGCGLSGSCSEMFRSLTGKTI